MDIEKCIQILNDRLSSNNDNLNNKTTSSELNSNYCISCNTTKLNDSINNNTTNNINRNNEMLSKISSLTNLELLNLFTSIQSERIMIYKDFSNGLHYIIDNNNLPDYTHLCSEMTSTFGVLSKQVITIKDFFYSRGFKDIAKVIESIQAIEKDKLLYNASLHLELLRRAFPNFTDYCGLSIRNQVDEMNKKIEIYNEKLVDLLEEIQSFKCDLV